MAQGKAEGAGGLTHAKDGNAALHHFDRRTLPIFKCADYNTWAYMTFILSAGYGKKSWNVRERGIVFRRRVVYNYSLYRCSLYGVPIPKHELSKNG